MSKKLMIILLIINSLLPCISIYSIRFLAFILHEDFLIFLRVASAAARRFHLPCECLRMLIETILFAGLKMAELRRFRLID